MSFQTTIGAATSTRSTTRTQTATTSTPSPSKKTSKLSPDSYSPSPSPSPNHRQLPSNYQCSQANCTHRTHRQMPGSPEPTEGHSLVLTTRYVSRNYKSLQNIDMVICKSSRMRTNWVAPKTARRKQQRKMCLRLMRRKYCERTEIWNRRLPNFRTSSSLCAS